MAESVRDRVEVEDDFSHNVGLLVTPLSNYALSFEFFEDFSLSVLSVSFKDLIDSVQT